MLRTPPIRSNTKRKLAVLSPEEEHAWVFAFNYHLDRTHSEIIADKIAWRDVKMEFSRLRGYQGCEAFVRTKWEKTPH